MSANSETNRLGGIRPIKRLLAAIEYPDRMPDGDSSFMLRVDGAEIHAAELDGRVIVSRKLTDDDSLLPALASYAAGRMLKEDATLSYGQMPGAEGAGQRHSAFLWQDVQADAGAEALLRLFETFMDSCDWWQARVDALAGSMPAESASPDTMVIRP